MDVAERERRKTYMNELRIDSIHCDRLSITGRLDWKKQRSSTGEWKNNSNVLRKLFNPMESQIACRPNRDNGLYSDDFIIPTKESGSSIFIQANRHYTPNRDFRIDFNPSKLTKEETEWIVNLLRLIQYKKATRVDMAANFHQDLLMYKLEDGRQRSSVEFKDRYGNIETLYRGSQNSDNYLKMYDKRKERESKYKNVEHDWWRIEETIKDAKANTWNEYEWFKGIRLIGGNPSFPEDTKARWKAAVFSILYKHMTMDEFPPNDRTTIRRLLEQVTFDKEVNIQEEIKKAPYQQMLNDALDNIGYYLK